MIEINDTTHPRSTVQPQERPSSVGQDQAPSPSNGKVDPLAVAFYYLMEASSISSQSALLHAKQLSSNANAQAQLNQQGAQLQLSYVPYLQKNHHTWKKYSLHWTWSFWNHGGLFMTPVTVASGDNVTCPNEGAVGVAASHNQQVTALRQTISENLACLQQNAQASETQVNSIADESSQSVQVGTDLLQTLQSLSFQAMMRQQPQG